MSVSPASIDLILATMDLKMVQSVIGAMRAADAAVAAMHGAPGDCGPIRAAAMAPRRVLHPTPRIEPRRVIRPTPRIEPRPVLHPPCPAPPLPPPPPAAEPPHKPLFHLTPPWKILPWKNPPQPALRIKVVKRRPDIQTTGTLLNVVI